MSDRELNEYLLTLPTDEASAWFMAIYGEEEEEGPVVSTSKKSASSARAETPSPKIASLSSSPTVVTRSPPKKISPKSNRPSFVSPRSNRRPSTPTPTPSTPSTPTPTPRFAKKPKIIEIEGIL